MAGTFQRFPGELVILINKNVILHSLLMMEIFRALIIN